MGRTLGDDLAKLMMSMHEDAFREGGILHVAGVDEVGRGPLAGPVVAAAVVVGDDPAVRRRLALQVQDSKALSAAAREEMAAFVRRTCGVGVGQASVEEIDRLNIRQATLLAMTRAVQALPVVPGAVLVDGVDIPPLLTMPGKAVVKGDATEMCIAAASVVAKVTRDALMAALAKAHPHYGWEHNAGYGTAAHLAGLARVGVSEHHRRSFAPVRDMVVAA